MTPVMIRFILVPGSHQRILGMGGGVLIVCSLKHQSTPPRPFRLQDAIISRADGKKVRPAVHIYCVDVLAAPAAFVR